ncbi:MAG: hypothetical protein WKF86_03425 [Acidimicrobiales bacterium]
MNRAALRLRGGGDRPAYLQPTKRLAVKGLGRADTVDLDVDNIPRLSEGV